MWLVHGAFSSPILTELLNKVTCKSVAHPNLAVNKDIGKNSIYAPKLKCGFIASNFTKFTITQ